MICGRPRTEGMVDLLHLGDLRLGASVGDEPEEVHAQVAVLWARPPFRTLRLGWRSSTAQPWRPWPTVVDQVVRDRTRLITLAWFGYFAGVAWRSS